MKNLFVFLSIILITSISYAQKAPMKWGKISDKEKNMTVCPYDSSANAVVLYDYSTISYMYGQKFTFNRHIRIKILNSKGFSNTNIRLPFYSRDNKNTISKIKAQTINISSANELEIITVDKNKFYTTNIDSEYSEMSFAFPDIKEGSIIEYSYTYLTENFASIRDWNFQTNIPVIHSEIRASINESLDYQVFYQGNRLRKKYNNKPTNMWVLNNLQAINEEPYSAHPDNFVEKLSFQLVGYKELLGPLFNETVEYVVCFMATPQKVAEEIKKQYSVKGFFTHGMKAKSIIEKLGITDTMTDENKYKKIHNYMITNYEWTGQYGLFPYENISSVIDNKSGTGASLNLLFHMLLYNANINSKLLYISTVNNGMINNNFLNTDQFNHVINLSYIDGNQVFSDVSCAFCPPGELPPNDLNIKGLEENGSWISFPTKKNNIQNSLSSISFKNNSVIYYNENSFSGITAQKERKTISGLDKKEYFEEYINPNSSLLKTDSFKVLELNNTNKNLITKSYYSNNKIYKNAAYIYIEALPFKELKEKVFISDNRELPVDFIYPRSKNYYINITIPDGYELTGKPEQKKIALPDKSASFLFKLNASEKNIQIQIKYRLNRTFYHVNEYASLKKFFELMNDKCNEKIIFKKII